MPTLRHNKAPKQISKKALNHAKNTKTQMQESTKAQTQESTEAEAPKQRHTSEKAPKKEKNWPGSIPFRISASVFK
ncbi:hypothetical protein F8M41_015538 [Gigaspora margarita]|uniref:Uncharacterized protein n=1 Tax=Gigaspora margarita TaxID=4874 RepID=A0A8H3WW49_GIGMA|nr:hypothetical protein F8M41_015538 [Gigaspora margarita]